MNSIVSDLHQTIEIALNGSRHPTRVRLARASVIALRDGRVQRRDRLGGLVHEYVFAA
jgi:hypothetical protein